MNVRHHLMLVLLSAMALTCAETRPTPSRGLDVQPAGGVGVPATQPQFAGGSVDTTTTVAPVRSNRRPRPSRSVPVAGNRGPKTFDRLAEKMGLFEVTPGPGIFSFCLSGSKPKGDPVVFQALIRRNKDVRNSDGSYGQIYRLGYVQAAAYDAADFNECVTMAPGEPAAPLRNGELVTIASCWSTRGPVTLTLSVEEVLP